MIQVLPLRLIMVLGNHCPNTVVMCIAIQVYCFRPMLCLHRHVVFLQRPLQKANVVPRQKPQTLDSLFANMKEQRMRVFSTQPSNGPRRNGVGQPRVPWARNRFYN